MSLEPEGRTHERPSRTADPRTIVSSFLFPPASAEALLKEVLRTLGVLSRDDRHVLGARREALRDTLIQSLASLAAVRMQVVVVLEDAHQLSSSVLDEIRQLCELLRSGPPVAKFVLIGPAALDQRLRDFKLQSFVSGGPLRTASGATLAMWPSLIEVQRSEEHPVEPSVRKDEPNSRLLTMAMAAVVVLGIGAAWAGTRWLSTPPVTVRPAPAAAVTAAPAPKPVPAAAPAPVQAPHLSSVSAAKPPAPASAKPTPAVPAATEAPRRAARPTEPETSAENRPAVAPAARPAAPKADTVDAMIESATRLSQRADVKGLLQLRERVAAKAQEPGVDSAQVAAALDKVDMRIQEARLRQLEIDRRRFAGQTQ